MRDIKEIFEKIQQHKQEQREINRSLKDALKNSAEYQDLLDQMNRLKARKISIESSVKGDIEQKIDLLKLHIKESTQTMSDIALTTLMKGESIRIIDSNQNEYEPIFSVRFKKTTNRIVDEGQPDHADTQDSEEA